ncbi:putative alanine racemase [Rhodovulum sulfidophilum]|uniref:Putative alanine racemase n=1 Tax=Rhodovulum sulfidophilum TaxID=35806 RepID=A0A0D6AZT8_RHOSU|nr:putative alanine racemase [Rhodovulum sulfidophilum]
MITPRMEVDLAKIRRNALHLVDRLAPLGISVVGVTKGVRGHPQIARAMLDGGVAALGDARVANVERMRAGGITAPIVLIRTPVLSQVDRIVRTCGTSLNTDFGVIEALSNAARRAGRIHQVILMIELGDGREGLPFTAVCDVARRVSGLSGVSLAGIGANFACLTGRGPSPAAMHALSRLAAKIERGCGIPIGIVSGGNSANLSASLLGAWPLRVNQLRLGEAILLGRDPLTHLPIDGLATDAFTLVAEVIESAIDAPISCRSRGGGPVRQPGASVCGGKSLIALGDQDTDTGGLSLLDGVTLQGSTSDHLVLRTSGSPMAVGSEVRFQPSYPALMRAMSAPDIAVRIRNTQDMVGSPSQRDQHLELGRSKATSIAHQVRHCISAGSRAINAREIIANRPS